MIFAGYPLPRYVPAAVLGCLHWPLLRIHAPAALGHPWPSARTRPLGRGIPLRCASVVPGRRAQRGRSRHPWLPRHLAVHGHRGSPRNAPRLSYRGGTPAARSSYWGGVWSEVAAPAIHGSRGTCPSMGIGDETSGTSGAVAEWKPPASPESCFSTVSTSRPTRFHGMFHVEHSGRAAMVRSRGGEEVSPDLLREVIAEAGILDFPERRSSLRSMRARCSGGTGRSA